MSRIYIFTGKGGVGKTSVAAAHAVKSAQEGIETMLVSTDMAHNLGDLFEVKMGREPVKIADHLTIYEIDPDYVMQNDFQDITKCIANMLPVDSGKGMEEFGMVPGMEELFSLLKIGEIYREGKYERIIVDCAPTGETLSLLKFPELLSWYMERLFPIGKVAMRVIAPVSRRMFKIEMPNKQAMNDIERMYLKLNELQLLLKNPETTSIRLVCTPEKMVVEETKRNYMYMNLYNFNVDGLYINRILPKDIDNDFFNDWLMIQKKYVQELKQSFGSLPISYIPWYGKEIRGIDAVMTVANHQLTSKVFEAVEVKDRECFEQTGEGYTLSIPLPNASKDELDLYQSHSNVVIRVRNFKRNIPLPDVLRNYDISSAKLEDGKLTIAFEKED